MNKVGQRLRLVLEGLGFSKRWIIWMISKTSLGYLVRLIYQSALWIQFLPKLLTCSRQKAWIKPTNMRKMIIYALSWEEVMMQMQVLCRTNMVFNLWWIMRNKKTTIGHILRLRSIPSLDRSIPSLDRSRIFQFSINPASKNLTNKWWWTKDPQIQMVRNRNGNVISLKL